MLLTSPLTSAASGQESHNNIIDIPKVSGSIVIDARLNEPQWQSARKVLINNVTRPHDNIPRNARFFKRPR